MQLSWQRTPVIWRLLANSGRDCRSTGMTRMPTSESGASLPTNELEELALADKRACGIERENLRSPYRGSRPEAR